MSANTLEEILNPRSIAVIGASGSPTSGGYIFTQTLIEFGYKGRIYPVNPKYEEILGFKAYPSLKEIPDTVDYVISCVPASVVPDILKACPERGVKAVHVYTARLSETGRKNAAELEQEILRQARQNNVRLIGPNCIGLYDPGLGLSFEHVIPKEPGPVGMLSQSGGGARKLAYLAALRGIRFSKAISYGNALDLDESDFLEFFARDPQTKIILMYIEGVKNGRRFLDTLKYAASVKPVIMLKGGRGKSGMRAIATHTASMASSVTLWEALAAQSGVVNAKTFNEVIDLAVGFNFLPPIQGRRVGLAGGGGGATVLSADYCEEAGFDVVSLPDAIREKLKAKGVPIWDWINNPADMSIMRGSGIDVGDVVQMMEEDPHFDLIITTLRLSHRRTQVGISAEEYLKNYRLGERKAKPLMAVVDERTVGVEEYDSWSHGFTADVKASLVEARIPFYPTVGRAISVAGKMVEYYERRRKPIVSNRVQT